MSKIIKKFTIKREIEKLNKAIDLRIIKGLPYRAEARRHKFLLSQFSILNREPKVNFFQKMSHVFASFIL